MERFREQEGPTRGDDGDNREQRFVSMPRLQPLAIVDQFRNTAHERHDLAQSNHEGE